MRLSRRLAVCLALTFAACGDPSPAVPDARDEPSDAPRSDLDRLRDLVAALPGAANNTDRLAQIDAFFHDVAYAGGFPILEDGALGVAYYDDQSRTPSFSLSGDLNAWAPDSLPLVQPVPGFPFYYLITPFTPPTTRSLYKLVHAGTDFFADPHARRFGWDDFGSYSLAVAGTAASHVERWPAFAGGGLAPREVDVYVPAGYDSTTAQYPTLYMHDGQSIFDPNAANGGWHVDDAVEAGIADGTVAPLLVVGVWNTPARMDEYTHTTDDIGQVVGGSASEYALLIDDVVAFVETHYRARADHLERAVMGSSLGGLISAYLAVTRPQTFGFAGSMSGTFGWGSIGAGIHNPTLMQLATSTPPTGVTFYLDSGGGPGSGCADSDGDGVHDDQTGDGDNYCETLDFQSTLMSHGWTAGSNLFYVYAAGAQHYEPAWAARMPYALRTWFPGK